MRSARVVSSVIRMTLGAWPDAESEGGNHHTNNTRSIAISTTTRLGTHFGLLHGELMILEGQAPVHLAL